MQFVVLCHRRDRKIHEISGFFFCIGIADDEDNQSWLCIVGFENAVTLFSSQHNIVHYYYK